MLKTFVITFLFLVNLYPQITDTTKSIIPETDTTTVFSDTLRNVITDTTNISDTTDLLSTKEEIVKADTLIPLYHQPFYNYSEFLTRNTIEKNDYRYTSDILQHFPLNFIRDYGFIGYPDDNKIYGAGYENTLYFEDGIMLNNRFNNYYDLNFVQSEYIDSIEIIPSPRGFLYGPLNQPVSINFLQKDIISVVPYTRIKYYEGPEGEAFIDGMFSALLFDNLNLSFDVTNRKVDETYENTAFSIWQGKIRLKYLLSDKINITGYYDIVDSEQGLNGGVDIDSLAKLTDQISSNVYDIGAPVRFPNSRLNYLHHKVGLKMIGKFFENSYSSINLYYNFNLTERRFITNQGVDEKLKTVGAYSRHKQSFGILSFDVIGNYEKTDVKFKQLFEGGNRDHFSKYNRFSLSTILSLHLFDSTLVSSVFYKFNNVKDEVNDPANNYNGYGADIYFTPFKSLKLYAGYSLYPDLYFIDKNVTTFETGVIFNYNKFYSKINVFNRANLYNYGIDYPFYPDGDGIVKDINFWGVGAAIDYRIWDIKLETNAGYYIDSDEWSPDKLIGIPKLDFEGGIYYKNILFNENLDLKTGFVFYYTGKQHTLFYQGDNVEDSYKVDFTLAGEIQEVAIVYFTWENITGNNYFITPFYPMPGSGVRFGLAWELFN